MTIIENILGTNYKRIVTEDGEIFLNTSIGSDREEYERIIAESNSDDVRIDNISPLDRNYKEMKRKAEGFFARTVNPDLDDSEAPTDDQDDDIDEVPTPDLDESEVPTDDQDDEFEEIPDSDLDEPERARRRIEREVPTDDQDDEFEEIPDSDLDEPERARRRIERAVRRKIRNHSKGLKIAAAVALLATIAGIGYSCSRKNNTTKKQQADNSSKTRTTEEILQAMYTNKGISETINYAFSNNEVAKEFYTTLYETLNTLNLNASKDSFVNGADKESNTAMRFTYKEVMSAMLALNDYSDEDLYKIFGDTELNKQELVENYQNFVNKMIIYSMNAISPSGVDRLIKDEGNKTLVKLFDSAIATFNRNVNHENADRIIRYFDYYVIQTQTKNVYDKDISSINTYNSSEFESYKANTSDKKPLNDKTSDYVRHLVINMVQGYMNANSQGDYKAYRIVSSNPANFDKLFTNDYYAQVQKGTNMEDYYDKENDKDLSIVETAGCTTEKVIEHIESLVDGLSKVQKSQRERLTSLSAELIDAKKDSLADLVIDGLTADEKEQIAADKKGKDIIAKYSDIITVESDAIRFFLGDGFKRFEEKTFNYGDVNEKTVYNDFAELFNNRIRGYSKVSTDNKNVDSIGESREQTRTETKTETKEVSESELSSEERASVEKQKEEIDNKTYQVTIGDKTFDQGEASRAAKKGWDDATDYAVKETGSYKHGQIINKINPDYPSVVPVDETLFDIATNTYAFNGTKITSSDSQIQARLASDIAKFGNSTYSDAYKEGWLQGIEQVLSSAVSQGAIVRSEAEELYKQAQQAASEKNEKENTENNNDKNDDAKVSTDRESEVEIIDDLEVQDVDNVENVEKVVEEKTVESKTEETVQSSEVIDTLEVYDVDSDDIMNPTIVDSMDGIEIYDVDVDGYNIEEYWEEHEDEYYALTDEEFVEESDKVLSKSMN